MKPIIVSWVPAIPERETREFATFDEALAFAGTVVDPKASAVDVRLPDGRVISVFASDANRG